MKKYKDLIIAGIIICITVIILLNMNGHRMSSAKLLLVIGASIIISALSIRFLIAEKN